MMAISSGGSFLVVGDSSGTVRVTEITEEQPRCVATIKPHQNVVTDCLFHSENTIETTSKDGTAAICRLSDKAVTILSKSGLAESTRIETVSGVILTYEVWLNIVSRH